jgi:hypothetical protein
MLNNKDVSSKYWEHHEGTSKRARLAIWGGLLCFKGTKKE